MNNELLMSLRDLIHNLNNLVNKLEDKKDFDSLKMSLIERTIGNNVPTFLKARFYKKDYGVRDEGKFFVIGSLFGEDIAVVHRCKDE
jgi:hypothetical protein